MTHKTDTKKIPYGGGYASPRIEVSIATFEQGFASSPTNWIDDNGTILDDKSKYNYWQTL